MPDGTTIHLYSLHNAGAVDLAIMTYGGAIVSLRVPDRVGELADVVLGFDTLAGYLGHSGYFGAIVGRYCNRIAGGRFTLDGKTCQLAVNNGTNHLHGGVRGFDKVVWKARPFEDERGVGLALSHESRDGDEGYPGTLQVGVQYLLTDDDDLVIDYQATTDAATPVNLTQHASFNLSGAGRGDILGHELMVAADAFTPVDETMIPTGRLVAVEGSPFDFRVPAAIGARIDAPDSQLERAGGYDHNFVLRRDDGDLAVAARVVDPVSGRTLEVRTTEPGLQLYTGNFLDGTDVGKGGVRYRRRAGLCLETQHYPDSPNRPEFPSTAVRPSAPLHEVTVFRFSTAH
jgi:aldose 1-epimerase